MRALFFFLPSLPTAQRGLCGGESPAAKGDLRKRLKFMQALTPVVQKLTNAILRIILYPMDIVTGWVIDCIVTDVIRNRMIRIYEKDVFFIRSKGGSKEKNHPRRPRGNQSGREKRRDESFQVPYLKTFVAPILSFLTAPGSPRMEKNLSTPKMQ